MPRQKQDPPEHVEELRALAEDLRGRFQTVEDMTQSFIREAILRAVFRPGERLQQDNIAAVLGVSRMPVRASLRQLESEGLLTIHPHRGATVASLRPHQIAEIYELRILLETHLVGHAITNMTDAGLAGLDDVAKRLEDADELGERLRWRRTFYQQLYALADRPRTSLLVEQLRSSVGRYLLLRRVDEHPSGHFGLVDCVRRRDVEAAQQWLTSHLGRVSQELQDLVAADGEEPVAGPVPSAS